MEKSEYIGDKGGEEMREGRKRYREKEERSIGKGDEMGRKRREVKIQEIKECREERGGHEGGKGVEGLKGEWQVSEESNGDE